MEDNTNITEKKDYKKWGTGILIVVVVLGVLWSIFGGRKTTVQKVATSNVSNSETKKAATKTFKTGEKITTEVAEVIIEGKQVKDKLMDETGYFENKPSAEGNKFLILYVNVKNLTQEPLNLNSSSFILSASSTQSFSPVTLLIKNSLFIDAINPGQQVKKLVFFDVPAAVANSKNLKITLGTNISSKTSENKEIISVNLQ
jgi:Telomeric repeat-binding factor 2.